MKATLPLFALALAFGCSPDIGPTDPSEQVKVIENKIDKPADLLPMKSGNAWTYSLRSTDRNPQGQSRQSSGTPTLKVTKTSGADSTLSFVQDNKVMSELVINMTSSGAVQKSLKGAKGDSKRFNPGLPLYHWPMKLDEEKKWTGSGYRAALGDVGPMKATLAFKGEREVDTPAGRMKAYRFDTMTTYMRGETELGSTQSVWLVPKVGIVRSVEMVISPTLIRETEMKLESYTVK